MNKVFHKIDSLVKEAQNTVSAKYRRQRIVLYAAGLKAKIRQVRFALNELSEFQNQSDDFRTSTVPDEFTITDRVHFYCDAFWTFLYSSLDVLAQIINQAMKLELREEKVSFKDVNTKLQSKEHRNTEIAKSCDVCIRSYPFRNLDKYRNCSTHRRQIYVKEKAARYFESATDGYPATSTGPIVTVKRILCDDPLDPKPKIGQARTIPNYMIETQDKVLEHILQMLDDINIVK